VFDFYNPKDHTEVSIKRARNAYPPYPGTKHVSTVKLPAADHSADFVAAIFAAHEIRKDEERIAFFNELNRMVIPGGKIIVTEHLRDFPNFFAYNVGFFHFLPRATWMKTFHSSGWQIQQELKITPFVTTFILEKHGASA